MRSAPLHNFRALNITLVVNSEQDLNTALTNTITWEQRESGVTGRKWISSDCSVCLITVKLPSDGFKNKWKYLYTRWRTGECVVTGYWQRQKHKRVQKAINQIYGKKCLVDVVGCVQPPALYTTELDPENAAGRRRLRGWSRRAPALTLTLPALL